LPVFGVVTPHQQKITAIVSKLLEWYPKNARDLPWRRIRDPYCVYVSEVMLQQTHDEDGNSVLETLAWQQSWWCEPLR
jgi:adenine-specific DNA glycosylase